MTDKNRPKREGCGVCKATLGKFAYRNIGLCNRCRTIAAKRLGISRNNTSITDVPYGSFYDNLSDEQRDAFLSGREYKGVRDDD